MAAFLYQLAERSDVPDVTYYPPQAKLIEQYARDVCKALNITESEAMREFAGLIKLLVKIKVKQLNHENQPSKRDVNNGAQ